MKLVRPAAERMRRFRLTKAHLGFTDYAVTGECEANGRQTICAGAILTASEINDRLALIAPVTERKLQLAAVLSKTKGL